jgi:hypothetical protein
LEASGRCFHRDLVISLGEVDCEKRVILQDHVLRVPFQTCHGKLRAGLESVGIPHIVNASEFFALFNYSDRVDKMGSSKGNNFKTTITKVSVHLFVNEIFVPWVDERFGRESHRSWEIEKSHGDSVANPTYHGVVGPNGLPTTQTFSKIELRGGLVKPGVASIPFREEQFEQRRSLVNGGSRKMLKVLSGGLKKGLNKRNTALRLWLGRFGGTEAEVMTFFLTKKTAKVIF